MITMKELLEKTRSIKKALNYIVDCKVQEYGAKYCYLPNGGIDVCTQLTKDIIDQCLLTFQRNKIFVDGWCYHQLWCQAEPNCAIISTG
jgi:hypothetical protein